MGRGRSQATSSSLGSARANASRAGAMTEPLRISSTDIIEIDPLFLYRWEEAQQSHVLLYPEGVVKLNESAAAILGLCDGMRSVEEIVAELSRQYSGADIASSVYKFLEVSHAKSWIRVKS